MTTGTDAVLAAIDGALQDHQTSSDAMRWTPNPPAPAIWLPVLAIRLPAPRLDTAALTAAVERAVRSLAAGLAPLLEAVNGAARALRAVSCVPPEPPTRVEIARQRRVATMMRRRDRRAARRRMPA